MGKERDSAKTRYACPSCASEFVAWSQAGVKACPYCGVGLQLLGDEEAAPHQYPVTIFHLREELQRRSREVYGSRTALFLYRHDQTG